MTYTQLTQEQRYQIYALKKMNHSQAEERRRIGDMEIDAVIGKGHQGGLLTIADRTSRYTFIQRVTSKQAQEVGEATISLLKPVAAQLQTITADNGNEFAHHQRIAQSLQVGFYFAHPYASWERGFGR